MKSPVDFDSRPAKHISNKIRELARKVNINQRQEQRDKRKTSEASEYKLVHTPDRPQHRIDPSQIPSEEECKIYLQQLPRAQRETRNMEQQQQPSQTGMALGRKLSRKANFAEHNRFSEVPFSEKYTNPRAAPTPFLTAYQEDERRSLPVAATPHRPESALSGTPFPKPVMRRPGFNSLCNSPTPQSPPSLLRRRDDNTTTHSRGESISSDKARLGPHRSPTPGRMVEPRRRRPSATFDPGHRRCRMPNCDSLAVRSTRGLCDACEADFVIRPSVFYEDPAALVRSACPELAAFDNHHQQQQQQQQQVVVPVVPPLPRSHREVVETGHLAHEMRIVAPAESPKEIRVGGGVSPVGVKGPLPLRREGWDEGEVVQRMLDVPVGRRRNKAVRGSRQEDRGLQKQKSLVVDSSGGMQAAKPKSGSGSPILGWPGSEYYFDNANFPCPADEKKKKEKDSSVETLVEEKVEAVVVEEKEEEEEKMSTCCRDVKEKCESDVSHSLHLRELYKELREEDISDDEAAGEGEPSSPILSTFHVDSWDGDSLYADLPDLETECSTSPMTLIFGIPTRI